MDKRELIQSLDPRVTGLVRTDPSSLIGEEQQGSFLGGKSHLREFDIEITSRDIDPERPAFALYGEDIPKVSVLVRCQTRWAIFSRAPTVEIEQSGLPFDMRYARALEQALERQSLADENGG